MFQICYHIKMVLLTRTDHIKILKKIKSHNPNSIFNLKVRYGRIQILSKNNQYYEFIYSNDFKKEIYRNENLIKTYHTPFEDRFTVDEINKINNVIRWQSIVFDNINYEIIMKKYFSNYVDYISQMKGNTEKQNDINIELITQFVSTIISLFKQLKQFNSIAFFDNQNRLMNLHNPLETLTADTDYDTLYRHHITMVKLLMLSVYNRGDALVPSLIFLSPSALGFFVLHYTRFGSKINFFFEGTARNNLEFISSLNLIYLIHMHPISYILNSEINIKTVISAFHLTIIIYKKYDIIFNNKWFVYIIEYLFNTKILFTVINIQACSIARILHRTMIKIIHTHEYISLRLSNQMYYMLYLSIMFLNEKHFKDYFSNMKIDIENDMENNNEEQIEMTLDQVISYVSLQMTTRSLIYGFVNSKQFASFFYQQVMPNVIVMLHLITNCPRLKMMINMLYFIMPLPYRQQIEIFSSWQSEFRNDNDLSFLIKFSKNRFKFHISEYFNIAINIIFEICISAKIKDLNIGLI